MGHNTRGHAELGGSSAHIWANCPGSIALKRLMPPVVPTKYMLAGTAMHEVCELALRDYLEYKESGTAFPTRNFTAEEREVSSMYVDLIYNEGLEGTVAGKAWGIEEAFVIDEHLHMWGSVDFWAIYIDDKGRRVLYVADFKNGREEVPIKNNQQLLFYGCGIRQWLKENGKDIDYCRTAVIQPHGSSGEAYKECKYTAKQMDRALAKFNKAAYTIYVLMKNTLKTGDWCVHCHCQAKCTKYLALIEARTELMTIDPKATELPAPEEVPEEVRQKLLENRDRITKYLEKMYAYELNLQMHGQGLKSFKVVQGKSKRRWIDDEPKIVATLLKHKVEPYDKKLRAFGPLEKQLGRGSLDNLLELPRGKPLLVPTSDPRPAVANALDLLGDLGEAETLED